jgi:hypothetical protein
MLRPADACRVDIGRRPGCRDGWCVQTNQREIPRLVRFILSDDIDGLRDTVNEAHAFDFIFPSVAPGNHTLRMQFRSPNGGTIGVIGTIRSSNLHRDRRMQGIPDDTN